MDSVHQLIAWLNINQGFAMFLLTLVYVAATIYLVILGHRQAQISLELESNRIRPLVVFDIILQDTCVFLKISNVGLSPAIDVQIDINPKIQLLQNPVLSVSFLEKGIRMLIPGKSISSLVETVWSEFERNYPLLQFEGAISYADFRGKKYSDRVAIDMTILPCLTRIQKRDINDVAKELEKISGTLGDILRFQSRPRN